ncbi:nitroreductase family protein [Pseudogracilibacillus auburnensis]|uniref:Nitroreductase n=1 Tax=Pseudogracilibacillus auburnensis TaxID=1494959 RepID=A0A2V3VGP3_9BACI|nr:nitroreductase family protein [Pseudogracilibacillus auburnensis]MBO1005541.1 nitroreductase family protein [Pseudogracilibacillus auburnensis]PXW80986.1 nitroreductase [Pseudogracilibacillus auburnensis]
MNIEEYRTADYPIDPIYIKRWSPRSFSTKEVEQEKLNSLFEAARWAPSAANWQPWRFIFAKSNEDRKKFLSFLYEGNVEWCKNAPAFVAIASKTTRNEAGDPNIAHTFDTGTAWGYLSLEANRQGLITHGMGGFDRGKAKEVLHIPDEYDIHAIIAIGYHNPQGELSEKNKEREIPSNRHPIEKFVFEGKFVEG